MIIKNAIINKKIDNIKVSNCGSIDIIEKYCENGQ